MLRTLRSVFVLFVASIVGMCGGTGTPADSRGSVSAAVSSGEQLPPPDAPAAVPVPQATWTPAVIGADKGEMLADALRAQSKVALILPRMQGDRELETRIFQMVKAVAPELEVVSRNETGFDRLLSDVDIVPFGDTDETAFYLPKDHPLKREWLSKKSVVQGADAVLIVRPVSWDPARVQALREEKVGGCEAFEAALASGLAQNGAYFAKLETAATALLKREFVRSLDAALPFWQTEVSAVAEMSGQGTAAGRCAQAYQKYLSKYEQCSSDACPLAPRLFGSAGGVIGMIDEGGAIPDSCPTAGMRDYVSEIYALGAQAAAEVVPSLPEEWGGEMLRVGTLERLATGIHDLCAPRHRRIDQEALNAARKGVTDFLVALKEGEYLASWEPAGGQERISGVGVFRVLSRVRARAADPAVELAAMLRRIRQVSRCAQGTGKLFQVALLSPRDARVIFMDTFFEESLMCEDLPPR